MRRRSAQLILAVLAVILVADPASAADGARRSGDATYEVADDGSVHVRIDATVTNTTTDRVEGGTILRRYLAAVPMPIASHAANVAATSNGARLSVTVEPIDEYASVARVAIPSLFAGQTRALTLTYDVVGAAPRTDGFERANPAYALFVAFGFGDAGLGTVTVRTPGHNATEVIGGPLRRGAEGGRATYSASAIGAPDLFAPLVSSRNDDALATVDADVGTSDIAVRAWPGDAAWQSFAQQGVATAIPALEAMIGRPWPIDGQLQVVEAVSPYLRGYAGWFAPSTRTIEVGEDLDRDTLYHELSHAWFNNELFDERWIAEAFAEEYAWRLLEAEGAAPPAPVEPASAAAGARPLAQWKAPITSATSSDARASEAYGYETSAWVLHRLYDEIGADGLAKVIDAAARDVSAYGGAPGARGSVKVTSERFLDLLESIGGSTLAADLFAAKVFSGNDARLADRATARAHVAEVQAAAGSWTLPRAVRDAMDDWRFAEAEQALTTVRQVLALRDETAAALSTAAATPTSTVAALAEAADLAGLDALVAAATAERDAALVLAGAQARLDAGRSVPARIGLLGAHPEREIERARLAQAADDFDGVRRAAADLDRQLDGAAAAGWRRLGAIGAALLLIGVVIVVLRRRRGRAARVRAIGPTSSDAEPAPSPTLVSAGDSGLLSPGVCWQKCP